MCSIYQAIIEAGIIHVLTVQVKDVSYAFVAVPVEAIMLHTGEKLQCSVNININKIAGSAHGYDIGYDIAGNLWCAYWPSCPWDTGEGVKIYSIEW
ncbi:unnamed protein product [marine sediment metagenome]|uniref:Uncharacterized protein n=1 Tax=marine sediment metagenome TaxID=412755 RepID=X1PBL9_9ZZZZ